MDQRGAFFAGLVCDDFGRFEQVVIQRSLAPVRSGEKLVSNPVDDADRFRCLSMCIWAIVWIARASHARHVPALSANGLNDSVCARGIAGHMIRQ